MAHSQQSCHQPPFEAGEGGWAVGEPISPGNAVPTSGQSAQNSYFGQWRAPAEFGHDGGHGQSNENETGYYTGSNGSELKPRAGFGESAFPIDGMSSRSVRGSLFLVPGALAAVFQRKRYHNERARWRSFE